jgi:Protein of unknown function (DUF2029).
MISKLRSSDWYSEPVLNGLIAILLVVLGSWTVFVTPESDFVQNYVAARGWTVGLDPNGKTAELRLLCCLDSPVPHSSIPQTAHPPFATLFVMPWALLPWDLARWLWMLFGCVMVLWAWHLLEVPALIRLLTLSFVLVALSLGAFEPLLFACVAYMLWQVDRSPVRAGVALGLAIAIKTYPLVLLFGLVVTKRWRAAGAAVITAGVLTVLAELILGFGVTRDWLAYVPVNSLAQADQAWNVSTVRVARVIIPNLSPTLAFIGMFLFFGLTMIPALRRDPDLKQLVPVMLLVSPISWAHYFLFLATVKLPRYILALLSVSALVLYLVWVRFIPGAGLAPVVYGTLLLIAMLVWYLNVRAGLRAAQPSASS